MCDDNYELDWEVEEVEVEQVEIETPEIIDLTEWLSEFLG